MKKEEILLNEPEFVETKPNKVKIVLAILASTLVVATMTTLIIGHFKFDWFKSDEYKIDAHINRSVYQANYFSEKKTINARFSFDEHSEEKQYIVDNDFVVFLTEKKGNIRRLNEIHRININRALKKFTPSMHLKLMKQIRNLNSATLVLLSSTASIDDEVHELPHLNMFDEEKVKDLDTNPDGSEYPIAKFKFTDDGKIEEINLPNNMDEYNAESILELIKKVIPKLSGSKKEDISNGLEISSKKVQNKRTIIQSEAPKQYEDFEGSRLTKVVRTEIENDQVTNIESDKNLHIE